MKNKKALALKGLIGNTPMLEIHFKYKGHPRKIFAKAESLNMTGSIKDRMAYHILSRAYEKGTLEPGMPIFEATSGNTGISVAAIGKALGHEVNIFMPDWMSEERKNIIKSLGAKITLVSKEEGGFLGSIKLANEAAAKCNGFVSSQFSNEDNTQAHYITTGPEIWWQMQSIYLKPDIFVAGVGSGGTIMGVNQFLKTMNPDAIVCPLEPANSPTLTTGHKVGKHRIQGISDEFIPAIVNLQELDEIIAVDDGDAIIMAQKLASQLGLGVGISSGANFIGALMLQIKYGLANSVVTIFCDSNKKYLSTDLLKEEPIKEGFYSSDVEFTEVIVHKRAFAN
ncbi:MAG: cysteine synthase [Bacteroidetes bacterium B1(2017)]|nr:MAG: cysteine synthase [Bacteroidetes bacterium B1(2017)]